MIFTGPSAIEPFFHVERRELRGRGAAIAPRRLTRADIPQLAALYDALTPACRIARDEAYWRGQLALFDALGAGAYGWFAGETLTAYAFCWADNAQEALGLTEAQEQGLLQALGRDTLAVTGGRGADRARLYQMA